MPMDSPGVKLHPGTCHDSNSACCCCAAAGPANAPTQRAAAAARAIVRGCMAILITVSAASLRDDDRVARLHQHGLGFTLQRRLVVEPQRLGASPDADVLG